MRFRFFTMIFRESYERLTLQDALINATLITSTVTAGSIDKTCFKNDKTINNGNIRTFPYGTAYGKDCRLNPTSGRFDIVRSFIIINWNLTLLAAYPLSPSKND